jgi:type II secretory pathway component PulC
MKSDFWTGLTALLGSICLLLLVLAGICAALLGGAPENIEVNADEQRAARQLNDLKAVSFNDRSTEVYTGAILENPLFFADRSLPEIIDEEAAAALAAAEQAEQEPGIEKLDARLAGIIISPDQRIAMIADNKSKKTMVMQEGMALEGEQAAWRLDRIDERMVSFAAGDESAELELEVNTKGLQAPAMTSQEQTSSAQTSQQQSAAEITSNARDAAAQREQTAAEIRRRIAERRAQLRAERARQAQDGNNND